MKKMTILKSLIITALFMLGFTNAFSQNLTVNTETLRRHNYDAASVLASYEATDSVTTGSMLRYYVVPDATANPLYTAPLVGSLSSAFVWSFGGATGTAAGLNAIVPTFGAFGNYQQITWSGTGTINLNAQENSGTCTGPLTTIPVAVIAVPTATFGADPASFCTNNPVQTFTLPVTLNTAVVDGNLRINYTVYNPDATVLIAAQDLNINKSSVNYSVTLTGATQYGTYYVIINSVTDRISRKPITDITGTIADNRIDLVVNRIPVTGPIYHLPNN